MATTLKIIFRGKNKSFFEPLRASIVLGDHGINPNGDHLVSADCANTEELEAQVDSLKSQLDKILRIGQKEFAAKSGKK